MSILTRINRLIRSNINDFLSPETPQSPRDLIEELKKEINTTIEQRQTLKNRLDSLDKKMDDTREKITELEKNAVAALGEDNRSRAEHLISKKHQVLDFLEKQLDERKTLSRQIDKLETGLEQLRDKISTVEKRLKEDRSSKTSVTDRQQRKPTHRDSFETGFADDIFEEAEEQISAFEASVEAERQLDQGLQSDKSNVSDQLSEPDDDLADLKNKFKD